MLAALGALVLGAPGCATWPRLRGPDSCTPRFDYSQGWLGGDAAYSVPLPGGAPQERRTIWLFGDTFVADAKHHDGDGQRDRVGAAFIHNSIGISRCEGNDFEIEYHWSEDERGQPVAFIESGDGNASRYWWLFDGFVHDGALYLGLLDVEHVEATGPLRMPFALRGMSLARIDDPTAPPATWRPEVMPLSKARDAFPGAAMQVEGDQLLLFSFMAPRTGRQARFLARLPLSALDDDPDDLEPHLETLTQNGAWVPGFLPARALVLMPDSSSEMSVAYHPELPEANRWLAVYGSPLQVDATGAGAPVPSGAIYGRTAPRPEGPWSERVLLHEIAEVGRLGRSGERGTICYAAKEHPAFAEPGELLITYVCNLIQVDAEPGDDTGAAASSALRRLQRNMKIYVPRVIEIKTPDALREAPRVVEPQETATGPRPVPAPRVPALAASPSSSRAAAPGASPHTRPSASR